MELISLNPTPIHEIDYQLVETGGKVGVKQLPVLVGTVDGMPRSLEGLIITSDLQGVEPTWQTLQRKPRLIGEFVAEELDVLSELGEIPPSDRIGVVLAGDLYVSPDLDKRGGKGDVRDIWFAFHRFFRWVTGIAGNHDRFGTDEDLQKLLQVDNIHYLDGNTVKVDSLLIGGVGGIIGNPSKPFRRSQENFLNQMNAVLAQRPDILILHQGPDLPEANLRGTEAVRRCLERAAPLLVICGHSHWDSPDKRTLKNGSPVLNVDSRIILLCRAKS